MKSNVSVLNEKELKSVEGGIAPALIWAGSAIAGGAAYDFSQGFIDGFRKGAQNGKKK
ncbi:TPA: class IIb bacteriocin, lactobin A/cerein 7B family [Staphylococcus aureus]|uniref:class IIb bacteriocin, lactobin A/cerein 7B family n=1 Tax=Staphylococcus warneri TaxID=1292 RepID=UPI00031D8F6F|nr:class IIb bacteriocin, lactobin A/cerein 7B family [Staphylococcus warneri]